MEEAQVLQQIVKRRIFVTGNHEKSAMAFHPYSQQNCKQNAHRILQIFTQKTHTHAFITKPKCTKTLTDGTLHNTFSPWSFCVENADCFIVTSKEVPTISCESNTVCSNYFILEKWSCRKGVSQGLSLFKGHSWGLVIVP